MKQIDRIIFINLITTAIVSGIFNIFTGIHVKNLGYGESVVGQVLSIGSISIAIGSMINAYLSSKIGFKKTISLGLILMFFGILGVSFFTNPFYIKIFSGLMGVGYGFPFSSVGVLLIENSTEDDRVKVFSKNFVVQSLGIVFASYTGGKLIKTFGKVFAVEKSIPLLYMICAVAILFSFYPLFGLRESKKIKSIKNRNFFKSFKEVMSGQALKFIIYNTIIGFGAGLVIPFFSVYLKFALNIDDEKVGMIMGLSQIGLVIGGLLVPYISKILGREQTVVICQLLSIPFLISIAFPQGIVVLGISFFLRSTLMNLNQPLIQNISLETVEYENRALMSSMVLMSSSVTRALSTIIAGYLMESISYNFPYYLTVALYLIGTIVFYKNFKEKKPLRGGANE
ncbi:MULTISPECIES: MFS transporter [Cetobacterium]|uniref:MFS transporter n=1 Tax=Candidatus Cetobacterium colombiensis TaxID=3073100 RepID=A0ABU4WAJ8_9FUSO|nr:MFS transporter [Candidatus Cetobacterium colombiensis]MDX8335709.1 MFS transporter [Candidatus Cetobacterium colombiensis]